MKKRTWLFSLYSVIYCLLYQKYCHQLFTQALYYKFSSPRMLKASFSTMVGSTRPLGLAGEDGRLSRGSLRRSLRRRRDNSPMGDWLLLLPWLLPSCNDGGSSRVVMAILLQRYCPNACIVRNYASISDPCPKMAHLPEADSPLCGWGWHGCCFHPASRKTGCPSAHVHWAADNEVIDLTK